MAKADLVELRREKDAAWDALNHCQMANIIGKTAEELVELDLATKRAERRYHNATGTYERALEEAINGGAV